MSQGYRNEGGIKVKTPQADPEASTEEVQSAKVKEARIQNQSRFSIIFCISRALEKEQRFFFHPVNRHLLSTQHTLKSLCQFFTFWVPLDLLHCLIALQYETVACAYHLCFHVESFKVCLNM
jgi:hypothetical protein